MVRKREKANTAGQEDFTRKAYQGIRQMLFHNEIGPDQKITYRDLAERLGMSTTPVIQALYQLELQGFVRREPNRGYYTETINLGQIQEIYDFRRVVEISLLSESIRNLNDNNLKRLQTALNAHLASEGEVSLSNKLIKDTDFHLTLASLSGFYTQQRILRWLYDLLYLKFRGNILFSSSLGKCGFEHQLIFDYVITRKVKKAEEALYNHITNIKEHVVANLTRFIADKGSEF